MTIIGFLLLVLVGAICGGVAEFIVGFRPGGFVTAAVVGFLGALTGGWIAAQLRFPSLLAVQIEGHSIEIVWSIIGAIVLLLTLSALWPRSYSRWHIT